MYQIVVRQPDILASFLENGIKMWKIETGMEARILLICHWVKFIVAFPIRSVGGVLYFMCIVNTHLMLVLSFFVKIISMLTAVLYE